MSARPSGLLIINADDWGGFRQGTDAIEQCFRAGAISSTTAMVYMADSRRAADLARENQRPTGLHLNFTQPFDAADVPSAARERQRRLCSHFANLGLRRWWYSPDPRVHTLVADGLRDQIDQYVECYGAQPTHLDSHHHVHVCLDVLFSGSFKHRRVRQTMSPSLSDRGVVRDTPSSVLRRAKHQLLARRFVTTDFFWRAGEPGDGFGAVPIAQAVAVAQEYTVELMVHPSFEDDLKLLCSAGWLEALREAPLGSYAMLSNS